ncbi:MAG: glycosyltransferase [Bacteroidota bacterium]|nr:glycosyltransferase [Bacteroidota bacterium]
MTISSVEKQSYPKELIQVILINDGSNDKTKEVLEKYNHKYLIIHTENKGVSHARNVGLQYAEGDFIQYLDSDDIITPDKIEKQVNALYAVDSGIAYGNWQKFVEIEGKIKINKTIERQIEGLEEIAILRGFWCPPAALLYARRIVQKIGPWKEWLPVIQDARYLLDAALAGGKFVHTPFISALYREHENGSLSTKSKGAFIIDCFKNAKSIHALWRKENKLDAEHKKALSSVLGWCLPGLVKYDRKLFYQCCLLIEEIDQNFMIKSSFLKERLCRLIGFRRTEILSYNLKRFFD